MKKLIESPGSATIINAMATGFGSAFGIDLDITCEAKTQNSSITCSNDVGAPTTLMELCAKRTFEKYGISSDEFGIDIKTKSDIPMASGLSSSSALSNGVVAITSKIIAEEFNLKPLTDLEIINLAVDASLEAKVTITGSFDDATASYFGGVVVTNNKKREFIIKEKMADYPILVYMPNFCSKSGDVDVNRIKVVAPLVEMAFELAKSKDYFKALNLNGLIYSTIFNFDSNIAIDALEAGALASALSGSGSSFVAICNEDKIDDVKEAWSHLEGRIIETKTNNGGCVLL